MKKTKDRITTTVCTLIDILFGSNRNDRDFTKTSHAHVYDYE